MILTDRLIISVIVSIIVSIIVRVLAFDTAEEVVAFAAGRKVAIVAAKDEHPATIFTDLAAAWIPFTFASLIVEVVVVTADLQSLLELCHLLLMRTWIRGKVLSNAASCSNFHASRSTDVKVRLVIISAVTLLPYCSAAIAELCIAATAVVLLAA